MPRVWSRNASGTYGPQCPDGHGVLLSNASWGDKLWCPACGTGNGRFFDPDDPAIVEGRSPNADRLLAAAREEEVMRVEQTTRAHREAMAQSKAARPRAKAEKAKAEPGTGPECLCGCGERTKGGRFRPGHDARYHAAQKKAGTAHA
jgi:hypothetical protein